MVRQSRNARVDDGSLPYAGTSQFFTLVHSRCLIGRVVEAKLAIVPLVPCLAGTLDAKDLASPRP